MQLSRREIIAGAGGGLAWASRARIADAQEAPFVVNTYGGRWENFWRTQLIPKLQPLLARNVKLEIGLGSAWVTGFRAAGKQAVPFSCLMTNERYAIMLRDDGFFEPLPQAEIPNLADLYPIARYPGNAAVTGLISPFGLSYRKDLVKRPPKSWRDLWNPDYRGQIGFYAIDNSAAIMLVMLAGKLFGSGEHDIETGIRKIAELKPFPQAAFSGQLSPMLTQGQIALAPIDYAEAYALIRKGVPLEMVVPEDGVLMYDQSFNIAASGTEKAAAAKYINFMLSPEVQLMLAKEFFVAPVTNKVKVPDELAQAIPTTGDGLNSILRFDWEFVAKNSAAILDIWSKSI